MNDLKRYSDEHGGKTDETFANGAGAVVKQFPR